MTATLVESIRPSFQRLLLASLSRKLRTPRQIRPEKPGWKMQPVEKMGRGRECPYGEPRKIAGQIVSLAWRSQADV
jgi:hypothetical protein